MDTLISLLREKAKEDGEWVGSEAHRELLEQFACSRAPGLRIRWAAAGERSYVEKMAVALEPPRIGPDAEAQEATYEHALIVLHEVLHAVYSDEDGYAMFRERLDIEGDFLRRLGLDLFNHLEPAELELHLILDNYATHMHANVDAWLQRHPRFHLHFTPTSSSWLNLIERWFRELTDKAIRRGVFYSVPDLIAAIEDYLKAHNDDPKPFVWTASIDSILEKVGRCKAVLETVH